MEKLNCLECSTELEIEVGEDGEKGKIAVKGQSIKCPSCGLIHRIEDEKTEVLDGKLVNNSMVSLRYDWSTRPVSIATK